MDLCVAVTGYGDDRASMNICHDLRGSDRMTRQVFQQQFRD